MDRWKIGARAATHAVRLPLWRNHGSYPKDPTRIRGMKSGGACSKLLARHATVAQSLSETRGSWRGSSICPPPSFLHLPTLSSAPVPCLRSVLCRTAPPLCLPLPASLVFSPRSSPSRINSASRLRLIREISPPGGVVAWSGEITRATIRAQCPSISPASLRCAGSCLRHLVARLNCF
jgi:hypothetical protein